jgi:hypothetical protein
MPTGAMAPEVLSDTEIDMSAHAIDAGLATAPSPPAVMPDETGPTVNTAKAEAPASDMDVVWQDATMMPSVPAVEARAAGEAAARLAAVMPQSGLTAGATAALAALANSAMAIAPPETALGAEHEETGHADPLAAVTALSVEERIALFS